MTDSEGFAGQDGARLALLRDLAGRGYRFTAPAPSTHRRVLLRRLFADARTLEDVFGWNMPFAADGPLGELEPTLAQAGLLVRRSGGLASALRVASIGPLLFYHSAFPARARDSVFLGPDSYRFVDLIRAHAPALAAGARIADIGTGAGVGGVFAGRLWPSAKVVLSDVNPAALGLARLNAEAAGVAAETHLCPGLPEGEGFDLVLANPPYLGGSPGKTYSDGGGALGAELSLDWTRQALPRLNPGGRFILYTGSAIAGGRDALAGALARLAADAGCTLHYEELDPDMFPSTLLHRAYWRVERIAAVGAVFTRGGAAEPPAGSGVLRS